MGTWTVRDGHCFCSDHSESFPKGAVCPQCVATGSVAQASSVARIPFDLAAAAKLPTTIDHEQAFVELAVSAEKWARESLQPVRRGRPKKNATPKLAHATGLKLLDLAIKARRAAHACARQREDWLQTESAVEAATALRLGKPSDQGHH
jgi:hypothetical protein